MIPCKLRFHRPMHLVTKKYFWDMVANEWVNLYKCDCEKLWLATSRWGFRIEKAGFTIQEPK